MGITYKKTEEEYLELIASIKWEKGFVCKSCGSTKYSLRPKGVVRCGKGHDVSIKKDTMFENSKLPVSTTFQILFAIQEELESKWEENYYDEGIRIRISNTELSNQFNVNEDTIIKLFERIYEWTKKKRPKDYADPINEWYMGIKDKKQKPIYKALYNFLVYYRRGTEQFPGIDKMIRLAVLKETYDSVE